MMTRYVIYRKYNKETSPDICICVHICIFEVKQNKKISKQKKLLIISDEHQEDLLSTQKSQVLDPS